MNRRSFFRSGVLGASGIMIGKTAMAAGKSEKEPAIIYRTLGKTGIKLPVVSMGVMRADNPNLVRAALAKGVKHLDTAHVYQSGNNEKMLGDLLKDYPRDSFTLATKVKPGGVNRETGAFTKDTDIKEFNRMFDISMERLQMDYVDILYVHDLWSREAVMYRPVLNAVLELKKQGRIKHIGLSTHRNMPEVIRAAADSGVYEVVLTTCNFQMTNWEEMNEAIAYAAGAGLGIVAMKTMAGGFFDRERQQPINVRAALKWALQNPNVHTSIPGFASFDELEESFSVMENLGLTDQELMDLQQPEAAASLFCLGCDQCKGQCPKGLPIPDLMRGYMYTYGYHAYGQAQELVLSLNLPENPCQDCDTCSVQCRKGFHVSEKIRDVARWQKVPSEYFIT